MPTITIYADYVCPYCLLAEQVISDFVGSRPIELEWRPFELRPEPVPTLRPEDPYLPRVWEHSVYPLAAELGVPIKLPSWSPQPRTAKAFELLALANERGLGHKYSIRAMEAFFQEDRNIGDPETLVDLAADVGIDPDEARRALQNGIYAERHREALRHAQEMAITSVPTIVVGGRLFRGTPPRSELRQAIDLLERNSGEECHRSSPGEPT